MGLGLGFFGSIVVGIIAGWLAEKIMKRGGGLLALFNKRGGGSWFLWIITATVGACIVLWIVGAITGRKK